MRSDLENKSAPRLECEAVDSAPHFEAARLQGNLPSGQRASGRTRVEAGRLLESPLGVHERWGGPEHTAAVGWEEVGLSFPSRSLQLHEAMCLSPCWGDVSARDTHHLQARACERVGLPVHTHLLFLSAGCRLEEAQRRWALS